MDGWMDEWMGDWVGGVDELDGLEGPTPLLRADLNTHKKHRLAVASRLV